jgi:hypothetical protein
MTDKQKKMKAALAAVAHYLEQEAEQAKQSTPANTWSGMGKEIIMKNRAMVQRRGRMIKHRA